MSELFLLELSSPHNSFARAAANVLDYLHSLGSRGDVRSANMGEFSSLRGEVNLSPGGSLDEHSHEASYGVDVSLSNEEMLDGFSSLSSTLVLLVDLEVALEVLSGGVPGSPVELSGLNESF